MNLRSLGELDLSFNEIHNNTFNRNGADWIDTMESLKVLDLSHNNIFYHDFVPYHTFSGLVNLESLNLRSNRITIDYGNFATNRQLKTLDLSYNKMTYFDLNFLLSVASLESLMLHGNNIAYASQIDLSDIRATFPEIKMLGLSENEFTCEMLSSILKKMLKANIRLLVDEENFVSDRRNLRGVSCVWVSIADTFRACIRKQKRHWSDIKLKTVIKTNCCLEKMSFIGFYHRENSENFL